MNSVTVSTALGSLVTAAVIYGGFRIYHVVWLRKMRRSRRP